MATNGLAADVANAYRRRSMRVRLRLRTVSRALLAVALAAGGTVVAVGYSSSASAAPTVVPPGLGVDRVLSFDQTTWGLVGPPALVVGVAFAPDGRIFAADKLGRVLMFDGPGDTTPIVTVDLRLAVNDHFDRGLLGIALDPQFAVNGWLYVLYTYDRDPFGNGSVPAWGANGFDSCGPPLPNDPGCVVSARVSRFQIAATGVADPTEHVLVDTTADSGWCEQFPSHSIGTLAFGADGTLYAGAGDGASLSEPDWGQFGTTNPVGVTNPCNDPPAGRGGVQSAPTAEGGSLRAQSARSTVIDGYSPLDGAIIRINPDGSIPADNPLVDNGVPGDDRIVAFGLRNPFRFSVKPGTNELWVGDVGNGVWEEVDRFTPSSTSVPNFGWPCYEGPDATFSAFQGFDLCRSFYADVASGATERLGTKSIGRPTAPYLPISHPGHDVATALPNTGCGTSSSASITGGSFVTNAAWPAALQGAYVFGDYAQACLWALPTTQLANPTPPAAVQIATGIQPVQILNGPDGNIYVVDLPNTGAPGGLWRFGNGPTATIAATPSAGPAPLVVNLSAAGSAGTGLSYSWDTNGDGVFGDAAGVTTTVTFTTDGPHAVAVRVTDSSGRSSAANQTVLVGRSPVISSITTSAQAGWAVGDRIDYSAVATDPGGGPLNYRWNVVMKHCSPTGTAADCHDHVNATGSLPDAPSGSFFAPTHEWRAILRVELTVTNSAGLSTVQSVELPARSQPLTVITDPPGLSVGFADRFGVAPFSAPVTEGATVQVSLAASQQLAGGRYDFVGWSDDPALGPNRQIDMRAPVTVTARFAYAGPAPSAALLTSTFEDGTLGGWSVGSGIASIVVTGAAPHTGTSSLAVAPSGSVWFTRVEAPGLSAGQTYDLSVWARTATRAQQMFLAGQWFDASGAPLGSQVGGDVVSSVGTTWTSLRTSGLVAPAGAASLEVRTVAIGVDLGTVTYLDDLAVTGAGVSPPPPPTTTVAPTTTTVVPTTVAPTTTTTVVGSGALASWGFESGGLEGWSVAAGLSSLGVSGAVVHGGAGAMVGVSSGSVWFVRSDVVGVVAGGSYSVGGWVRTGSGNGSVFVAGQWFGVNDVVIGSQVGGSVITAAGSSSWVALAPSVLVAPVGAVRLEVRVIGVSSTPGTVTYLDDLAITKV